MQTSCLVDYIHARTEVKMIGVAQYNLSLYIVAQLVHMHTFYRAHGTDGHEYRCGYVTVVGADKTGTGRTVAAGMLECEFHLIILYPAKLLKFSTLRHMTFEKVEMLN